MTAHKFHEQQTDWHDTSTDTLNTFRLRLASLLIDLKASCKVKPCNKYVENQRMASDTREDWSKTKNHQHNQRKLREKTENQRKPGKLREDAQSKEVEFQKESLNVVELGETRAKK